VSDILEYPRKPQRIRRCRTKGWRMPTDAVYVGRPSRWGNPFRIYHGHSSIGPPWRVAVETWHHLPEAECRAAYVTSTALDPSAAVDLYRTVMAVRMRDDPERLRGWLKPLVGKDLACWCPTGQACHADILLALTAEEIPHAA
jgi:Domain of unknown function (DUF4326)